MGITGFAGENAVWWTVCARGWQGNRSPLSWASSVRLREVSRATDTLPELLAPVPTRRRPMNSSLSDVGISSSLCSWRSEEGPESLAQALGLPSPTSHSVASLWRALWHCIFTATGRLAMWQG